MNNIPQQIKYGLIAGVILVVIKYLLLITISGISMRLFAYDYLATFATLGVICYLGIIAQRNDNKGIISFREAFFVCLFISFVTALMIGAFQYAYAAIIDPGRAERMVQATTELMKNRNAGVEETKQAVANARVFYSPGSQFQAGMSTLVVGLFISLIISLVVQKNIRNNQTVEQK
jgi:hypothetical protein